MRSAVGQFALDNNISLLQPEKVRNNPEFIEEIKKLSPDICIVVAYGKILPQELLGIPPMGFLNVHTSLLPKYRGAAPIQHALMNGEKVTGLTVQQMSLGMDEGDILLQESWDIVPSDTTGGLFGRTAERGGPLLVETLK
jgi:methionyl-tRNA formyltransferase